MRLLESQSNGGFHMTGRIADDDIPRYPYAILSHTWGPDSEEVIFEDLADGSAKDKAGYRKVQFCGEQAAKDKLRYFWVDSCCIKRSSDSELSESINSMFRWYQRAAKCYVYLWDVSTTKRKRGDENTQDTWERAFRESRWFTRGWTLQELLAPASVEFFSKEGSRLGDKRSLEHLIHEITEIPIRALQGETLSQFTTTERMSWAAKREAKRTEDKAYSLLGIFSIFMPLIYGEGEKNAFIRLQEKIDKRLNETDTPLNRLPYAVDAVFNAYNRQHEPSCLHDTRVDLLQEIYAWANSDDERFIFWLNGSAGTGKSTIARTVARKFSEHGRLGASFFFSKGGGHMGHAGRFFTTVAVELGKTFPSLQQYICDAIRMNANIATQSLRDQWRHLILDPLHKFDGDTRLMSFIVVIDALDECDNDKDIRIILQLLVEARSLRKIRLRVLLTSRPEIPIRYEFYEILEAEYQDFVLHNISPPIIDNDIYIFLEYNLRLIGQEHLLGASWPGEEIIRLLVQKASGLFIWAATTCRFIEEGEKRTLIRNRLSAILEANSSVIEPRGPEEQLNKIYTTVLSYSIPEKCSVWEGEQLLSDLKTILGSIVVLQSPLSVPSLAKLVGLPREDVGDYLNSLHAILNIPKDQTHPLRLHHPSFRDFLLNQKRCIDQRFWVDEKQAHKTLTARCIQLMSDSLKDDICEVEIPGTFVSEVEHSHVQQSLSQEVQYACLYWVQHLQKSSIQLQDNEFIHQFLKTHFLHWLEALSWMQKISEGIQEIILLESIIDAVRYPSLYAYIYDMKRFTLYNRAGIEKAPLQVYSVLYFSPKSSIVRKQISSSLPGWIRRGPEVETYWSATLQILEGHDSSVHSVAFSPDGKQLASGSLDTTIRVWDVATGATLQIFEGHSDSVYSVAFSPDGKYLASGSADNTVRIWDTSMGAILQIFEGHCDSIYAVAFLPDGKYLASGSIDNTIRIWDMAIGAILQILEGHSDSIYAMAISPNGKQLASGSTDKTIRVWDTATGATLQILEGHSDSIFAVAFSPDSKYLASGSSDNTLQVWDTATGAILQTFKGHRLFVYGVAFSPDSKQLASGSADNTVRVWDIVTGATSQILEGHSSYVQSIAFSPNGKQLVSGSLDNTVRIWDVVTGVMLQIFEGHSESVMTIAISPDSKYLVSGSSDSTVWIWDMATGATLQIFKGHSDHVYNVAFLPDGEQLVSGSHDNTVLVWNAVTGAILQIFKGYPVAVSPNGKQLASGSLDNGSSDNGSSDNGSSDNGLSDTNVLVWDVATGATLQILEGHNTWINTVAFSPDGKYLASGSWETVRVWDVATGATFQILECHDLDINAVAFSPDSKYLASGSWENTVRVWDMVAGVTLQILDGYSTTCTLSFSDDGSYLVMDHNRIGVGSLRSSGIPLSVFSSSQSIGSRGGVFAEEEWILHGSNRMLWLPPNYRPSCSVVYENIVGLGHRSGRVSIFDLSFKNEQSVERKAKMNLEVT